MDRKEKIEIIQQAIKQLIEQDEQQNTNIKTSSFSSSSSSDEENFVTVDNYHRPHQLLSKLLAELESLESQQKVTQSSQIDEQNEEETIIIVKELKNLKRQNLITHCLLSAMIMLNLAWQLSEVSLTLKVKDGLSNPLKSVGGLIGGFLKGGRRRAEADVQSAMELATEKQKQVIEYSSIPGIKIPHLDFLGFDLTSEDGFCN